MARFSFSLQKVLDVRQHLEDKKAQELGLAKSGLMVEEERFENLNTLKSGQLTPSEEDTGVVDITLLRNKTAYLVQLDDEIKKQREKVNKAQKEVDLKRNDLNRAVIDRKAMEILKEKKKDEFKKWRNREYAKQENEVALRMAHAQKVGRL